MGISRLFLKEIIAMCGFLSASKNKNKSEKLKVLFLGDQDIRVNLSQIKKFRKSKQDIKSDNLFISKNRKVKLKDLFPESLYNYLNIRTIDINGSPDLKMDITNSEEIKASSIKSESISHFIDIGTIEHVIDPYKAMCNISELIKIGGFISHLSPCSSYLNHGYYLISPQLLNDFYKNKNYKVLRFKTLSYFGNYDKNLSFCFKIDYYHNLEMQGIKKMLKKKKFKIALGSLFRRILMRICRETYISFTAKKISTKELKGDLLFQHQYEKN